MNAFAEHYTLIMVALGSAALGVVSGALGTFAVLRKQSLLGDAVSHAALPGIALAFLLTRQRSSLVIVCGAAVAGWIATLLVLGIVRTTRVKYDSALGLVLSVFFGLGLMLLTLIQNRVRDAGQSGLDKFLFGQAAALLVEDVVSMAALGVAALLVLLGLWKEFKLLSFDPDFATSIGYPVRLLDVLLTSLLVVAIVTGLQTVGVVLMSAMIVAPAAAARQWTDRLGRMVILAALFGAAAGVGGAVLSSRVAKLPTGPTIVLCVSGIVVVSLLFAPNRGLVWAAVYQRRNRRQLRLDAVLADLVELSRHHPGREHGHAAAVLQAMSGGRAVERTLDELRVRGWAWRDAAGEWVLTDAGRDEAIRRAEARGT